MVVDTSIFIEYLRAGNKKNTALYHLNAPATFSLSAITIFELSIGATTPEKRNDIVALTEGLPILPFDEIIADKAAEIYLALKKINKLIEFRDIFIAATAVVHNLPPEFDRVKAKECESGSYEGFLMRFWKFVLRKPLLTCP